MGDAARAAGVRTLVGLQTRYAPSLRIFATFLSKAMSVSYRRPNCDVPKVGSRANR